MGCIVMKKKGVRQGDKKDSGSSANEMEQDDRRVVLFVVKEEHSYLEQSYAPSKRQSVAHNSGRLLEKIEEFDKGQVPL